MTDEVMRVEVEMFLSVPASNELSFFGLLLIPQLSLRVLSWPLNMLRLEAELFLRFESRYVVDFTEGLGLGTVKLLRLFIVADTGNRGGGILSCFGGWGGYSDPLSFAACETLILLFEVLLFHPRLNFRRKEVAEDGVVGSSGLDISGGVSIFDAFVNF